ncbi:hypothetical protein F7734_28145 [Scytonema sp. UIC 10036]|uniref:hypothetical protein n=1 Tax=Scytonema sp. UIC 10036 TaxID=2304196 RepID=UPI0012DAA064|nr:hypothetical protein [Scytonema sp. UIC 10036]MUG96007.1 hypothetical protein [Scytonema sp. UIC 10036]
MATTNKQKIKIAMRKSHGKKMENRSIETVETPKIWEMTCTIAKPSKVHRKYFRPLQAQLNRLLVMIFALFEN